MLSNGNFSGGFRPLAGIMVLIRQKVEEVNESKRQFPSPCGDYGSYHDMTWDELDFSYLFPSPCGDYGSYHQDARYIMTPITILVSVPLRGLWFLSISSEMESLRYNYRFRPLAGIMVLIEFNELHEGMTPMESFRPLAGIMVLIKRGLRLVANGDVVVSVPLRGLWFLSAP